MARAEYWSRLAAIERQRSEREARIGEGDFVGALGHRVQRSDEKTQEEFYLPVPDTTNPDGRRVWCF